MGILARRDFSAGWMPDADPISGPSNALLRADNLLWDELHVPGLRRGSRRLNSSAALPDLDVHSVFSATITGEAHRFAGAGNHVYQDFVDIGITFDGSGDIRFGAGFGQVVMARGTVKKKTDGTTVRNWGIAKPGGVATLATVAALSKDFATCAQAESPAFVASEGTITATYPTGEDAVANGAIEVTPAAGTGRLSITKTFAADTDYSTILGYPEASSDVFDIYLSLSEPEKVEVVTVMVGVSSTADPFQTDYYQFDFRLGGLRQGIIDITEGVIEAIEQRILDEDLGGVRVTQEVLDKIQRRREERVKERKDAQGSGTAWTRLSCLRAQFTRVGSTQGRNWSTVKAIKIIYKAQTGATGVVRFDSIRMSGGSINRSLSGVYKVKYVFVKNFGVNGFIEKSPPSDASLEVSVHAQGIQVTISQAAIAARDPQVDEIWIYMFGGVLDRYYRVGIVSVATASGIRLDEFARTADASFNAQDRTRLNQFEFTIPAASTPGDLTVDILKSEVDAFIENEPLDQDIMLPPDHLIDIEGPHFTRMFVLDANFLYPGLPGSLSGFHTSEGIKVGDANETPFWVKRTTGGLYVGTSKDIYLIDGDATVLPDGTLNLRKVPLNIESPPINDGVTSAGNIMLYFADDGWRIFDGAQSTPIPKPGLETLYKGQVRYQIAPVNLAGRFRCAVSKGIFSAITPEGAETLHSHALHRYDFPKQRWMRHFYPRAWRSVFTEQDGTLIAGDTLGFVYILDTGTQDHGEDIPVNVWSKLDDDGKPLNRKDAFDLTLRIDTGNRPAEADLYIDGNIVHATPTFLVTADGQQTYMRDISSIAAFRRIQLRLFGFFPAFKLFGFEIGYRTRPIHRMFVDTGYRGAGKNDLMWLEEVRFLTMSAAPLVVTGYTDSASAGYTAPAVAAVSSPTIRSVRMPRDLKGYAVRASITTSGAAGVGDPGFEVYWIELVYTFSGNQRDSKTIRIVPDEEEAAA